MLTRNKHYSSALNRVKQVQWARTMLLSLGQIKAFDISITCSVISGSKCRRDVDQDVSRTSGL